MPVFSKGYSATNLQQLADRDLCIIVPNIYWDESNRLSMKQYKYYLAKSGQIRTGEMGWYLYTHEDFKRAGDGLITVRADNRFTEYDIIAWALQSNGLLYPLIEDMRSSMNALCIDLFEGQLYYTCENYRNNLNVVKHADFTTMYNNIIHKSHNHEPWRKFIAHIHKGNNQNDFSAGCITLNKHETATAIKLMKNSIYGTFDNDENAEFKILESHPKIEKKKVDLSIGMESNYLLL